MKANPKCPVGPLLCKGWDDSPPPMAPDKMPEPQPPSDEYPTANARLVRGLKGPLKVGESWEIHYPEGSTMHCQLDLSTLR